MMSMRLQTNLNTAKCTNNYKTELNITIKGKLTSKLSESQWFYPGANSFIKIATDVFLHQYQFGVLK